MTRQRSEYRPDIVSPPGDTLQEILDDRGLTQTELALRMGRPVKTINEIIKAKAALTPDTALQLERALGIPASFWNNFERRYRESLASRDEGHRLEANTAWLDSIPWKDMIRQGWIQKHREPVDQFREVLDFFGVATPTAWDDVCSGVAFRRSAAFESSPAAVAAWLRKGELDARLIPCEPYTGRFRETLASLRALTVADVSTCGPEIVRLCAEVGVALVFVPELPGTRVSGAARWLTPDKAILQLSLRYKSNDHFWFSFFHEAAHIVLHGRKRVFIDSLQGAVDEDEWEAEANRFAEDLLLSPAELAAFLEKGDLTQRAVEAFAEQVGIAPGIVVGRLQREGRMPWNTRMNRLKLKLDLACG